MLIAHAPIVLLSDISDSWYTLVTFLNQPVLFVVFYLWEKPMPTVQVTVELPETALEQLQQVSRQQRRSVPEVMRDLVLQELPGLPPLPQDMERELAAFAALSDDLLWLLARSTMTTGQQQELATLNDEAQRRTLTPAEQERQQTLVDQYDRVMVRRAQAAALLKNRGYDLSDPAVLQGPVQA